MSLPERLRRILAKLREGFEVELPDPDELQHTGEINFRGQVYTTLSSHPLHDFATEEKFTVYTHSSPGEGVDEHLRYFHFEGRQEISAITVKLDIREGNLQQSVTVSSVPREIFVPMVEREIGRGAPRERRGKRGRGADRGDRGNFVQRRPPPPMYEEPQSASDDS